jgi:hypothetical protein
MSKQANLEISNIASTSTRRMLFLLTRLFTACLHVYLRSSYKLGEISTLYPKLSHTPGTATELSVSSEMPGLKHSISPYSLRLFDLRCSQAYVNGRMSIHCTLIVHLRIPTLSGGPFPVLGVLYPLIHSLK